MTIQVALRMTFLIELLSRTEAGSPDRATVLDQIKQAVPMLSPIERALLRNESAAILAAGGIEL